MHNVGPSVFIPSDKNFFDALQQKRVTQAESLKMLRQRGIIVSPSLDKSELARIISQLPLSYQDYAHLTHLLENPNRKEKSTYKTVPTDAESSVILDACQSVAEHYSEDMSVKVIAKPTGAILSGTYTEVDFTRTELKQRTQRKCEIEVLSTGGQVSIRLPASRVGKDVANRLVRKLEDLTGESLEEEVVSLTNILDPVLRTSFFVELIKSLEGFRVEDVSSVAIYHELEHSYIDGEHENEESPTEEELRFAGYIRKAVLAGGGVLESREFNQMQRQGFFIHKVVWSIVDKLDEADKIELEAEFAQAASCDDFQYSVRGVFPFSERTGEPVRTARRPSRVEVSTFSKLVEDAAKSALVMIRERHQDAGNEDGEMDERQLALQPDQSIENDAGSAVR